MSLRCLHGHPCMTGGGAHSAEANDFPPGDGRSSSTVGVPDGYEHHGKQHSRRASARLAARAGVLPQRRCYRPMQRAIPCTRSGRARRWVRSDQLVREDRHAEEDPRVVGSQVAVGPAQKTPLISARRALPPAGPDGGRSGSRQIQRGAGLARAGGSPGRPLLRTRSEIT
jgi:hypothetical protein